MISCASCCFDGIHLGILRSVSPVMRVSSGNFEGDAEWKSLIVLNVWKFGFLSVFEITVAGGYNEIYCCLIVGRSRRESRM